MDSLITYVAMGKTDFPRASRINDFSFGVISTGFPDTLSLLSLSEYQKMNQEDKKSSKLVLTWNHPYITNVFWQIVQDCSRAATPINDFLCRMTIWYWWSWRGQWTRPRLFRFWNVLFQILDFQSVWSTKTYTFQVLIWILPWQKLERKRLLHFHFWLVQYPTGT